MHTSRIKKLLDEHNINYLTIYPHTEKVKLLNGTIIRLKELLKEVPLQVPPKELEPTEVICEEIIEELKVPLAEAETEIIPLVHSKRKSKKSI